MSKAGMNRNPKKVLPGANLGDRPGGCTDFAATGDPRAVARAALYGNRATRREAMRQLLKVTKPKKGGK